MGSQGMRTNSQVQNTVTQTNTDDITNVHNILIFQSKALQFPPTTKKYVSRREECMFFHTLLFLLVFSSSQSKENANVHLKFYHHHPDTSSLHSCYE